jgi:hypothetical protein
MSGVELMKIFFVTLELHEKQAILLVLEQQPYQYHSMLMKVEKLNQVVKILMEPTV